MTILLRVLRQSFPILLLFIGLLPRGADAQPPAAPLDRPEFFIETLRVEGLHHASREIIVSESLLKEGTTYSEARLRDAVHRIARLPFVLDAYFALEKGSVRDHYELVITVVETRRWFFSAEARQTFLDFDPFDVNDDFSNRLVAGRRFYVGKHGVLFAALGDDADDLALGYNHYNLFGRSILLSATYGRQISEAALRRDSQSMTLGLGIPLRTNQSLQLSGRYLHAGDDDRFDPVADRFFDSGSSRSWEAEAAWNFNSLDDPVLPSSGLLVDAGVSYSESVSELDFVDLTQDPPLREERDQRFEGYSFGLEAHKYWDLTLRHSLSIGATAALGTGEATQPFADPPISRFLDTESSTVGAEIGHAFFLLRNQTAGRWRELRWENRLAFQNVEIRNESFSAFDRQDTRLETGLVFRNGWGVFRATLSYVWNDRDTFR